MSNISFNIGSITLENANQKALHPDKNGIYKHLVLQVIGKPSRNGKIYEVNSMTRAITDPSSCFYKKLIAGQAFGEAGHPLIFTEAELPRIAAIDMSKVSHIVMKVYTGETTEKGYTLVYGDILPYGPYKDMLIESLESPVINTAFSLRSLVQKTGEDAQGNIIQDVQALISYDFVDAPGYAAASKIHSASDESLEIKINTSKDIKALKQMVSNEVISDHQLEDMLGVDRVRIWKAQFNVEDDDLSYDGKKLDIFHMFFNR